MGKGKAHRQWEVKRVGQRCNLSSESTELEGVHKGRRGGGEVCYLHALVWSLGRVAVTT